MNRRGSWPASLPTPFRPLPFRPLRGERLDFRVVMVLAMAQHPHMGYGVIVAALTASCEYLLNTCSAHALNGSRLKNRLFPRRSESLAQHVHHFLRRPH